MHAKRKRAVGLSICASKIALAEIRMGTSDEVVVERVGVIDTPDGAIENGRIVNPTAVSRAIRELIATTNINGAKDISVAIADDSSITRLQVLPHMSKSETIEALMGEVENYAILSGGEPALDFQILHGDDGSDTRQMEVLFVTMPRDLVNSYLSVMDMANLKLSTLETIPLAVLRAFTNITSDLVGFESDKPMMLVSIEENVGMIIIIQNKIIQFVHSIEIGSRNLQADRAFRELARELKSSMNYYQRAFSSERRIEEILLFTDEPDTANTRNNLESLLDIPVIAPEVPTVAEENTETGIVGSSLSAYAAIGTAIRMAKGREEASINLLSSLRRSETVSLRKRVTLFLMMLLILVFLSVGARFYINLKADSIESNLLSLQQRQEISEAEASKEIELLESNIAALRTQTEITDAAMNSIKWANCANILEETRAIVPKNLWLVNLRMQKNSVAFIGFALSYDSVFQFRKTLIASPRFDTVKIINIRTVQMSGREVQRFEIRCGVKDDRTGEEVSEGESS